MRQKSKIEKPMPDWNRPFSWSQLSSWEYDKEQWYRKYVLRQQDPETPEMRFGKEFAKSVEDGVDSIPGFIAALQRKKEHKFLVRFGKLRLVGFADAFCDETFLALDEIKTGKKAWTQKRVDSHGQFDMYLLMNWITNKIMPEQVRCRLWWIPTEERGDFTICFKAPVRVHSFETRRTMMQIVAFGSRINQAVKDMEAYCIARE